MGREGYLLIRDLARQVYDLGEGDPSKDQLAAVRRVVRQLRSEGRLRSQWIAGEYEGHSLPLLVVRNPDGPPLDFVGLPVLRFTIPRSARTGRFKKTKRR